MIFIHHVLLFIQNNGKQLQRKWPTLPPLFLFPIVIVGLTAFVVITLFIPEDNTSIQVGLVDEDQSKETTMVVKLIEESSSQLNNFIHIENLTATKAKQALKNNQISTYIVFPGGFTENLYNGSSVTLDIIGNPNKQVESFLVNELIESLSRHIKTAQANILTINYFAKQLDMNDETRNDFLFKQFTDSIFYTLGKDKILDQETLKNNVSSSPIHYYGLGAVFLILSIWLVAFYSILTREEGIRMKSRMRLYNVTDTQQLLAKIIVSWLAAVVFSGLTFCGFFIYFDFHLFLVDYGKIAVIGLVYSFTFLLGLAIIEAILQAPKIRLFVQTFYTGILVLLSGAVVPTIYFPYYIQDILPYSFSYQAFHLLQEIILETLVYVDFLPLIVYLLIGVCLFVGITTWKERVSK